jgi:hypothetical protein
MYELFSASHTVRVWKALYCEADFTKCERHKRSQRKEDVPINLLPNGKVIGAKVR